MAILDDVKVACRVASDTFDNELNMLISSAQIDLGIAGVELPDNLDSICNIAIITYCKMRFGNPDNYEQLKASYDEQKAQLSMSAEYTNFGG
jgi:hypothetical protein